MTPEDYTRRLDALTAALRRDPALCRAADEREAIRTRLQRRHEDALRALLAAILDATDDAARDAAGEGAAVSIGAKRAAQRERIYHAMPHHPGTPEHLRGRVDPHAEERAALLRELADLDAKRDAVAARLREIDDG